MTRHVIFACLMLLSLVLEPWPAHAQPLSIATFQVDASPPLGSPVAYVMARTIEDPLSARGVVLLGLDEPIVLCAVDFLGIGNSAYDSWREQLAEAAGTTASRVAVHTLHQHDAPRCDFDVEQLLAQSGMAGQRFDVVFCRQLIERVAQAVRQAISDAHTVTHVGLGQARVRRVASNRRILGADGKVAIVRYSKSTDLEAIAAPEGVIDPTLKMVSFWNGDRPLAALSYYATHPQSYYGQGDVTSEFVGLARAMRQDALAGVPHIHFNGASGNVAAGKYNNGSPELRPILAMRVARGMRLAWERSERFPVSSKDVKWKVVAVRLPPAAYLNRRDIEAVLRDPQADSKQKLTAAKESVWLSRCEAGDTIELSCLEMGRARLLHLPGELFVEYQLAAQAMQPDKFVAVAAYGDYSPGYIGTAIAYSQGGYEVQQGVSRVAPESEQILIDGIRSLLDARESNEP